MILPLAFDHSANFPGTNNKLYVRCDTNSNDIPLNHLLGIRSLMKDRRGGDAIDDREAKA